MEPSEKFFEDLAEYVGANVPFAIDKYEKELTPYIKFYSTLYRLWQDYSYKDFINNKAKEIVPPKQKYYATTYSFNALQQTLEEIDIQDAIISVQYGNGFEPVKILKDGINNNLITNEVRFVKEVISFYEYQKEVLLLSPIKFLSSSNIIAYVKNNNIIKTR